MQEVTYDVVTYVGCPVQQLYLAVASNW